MIYGLGKVLILDSYLLILEERELLGKSQPDQLADIVPGTYRDLVQRRKRKGERSDLGIDRVAIISQFSSVVGSFGLLLFLGEQEKGQVQ